MSESADVILADERGRAVLRFERTLPNPPEQVWGALTDPMKLTAWHPSPFEAEPMVGGTVTYVSQGDDPTMPDGEVIEYEPPRVLAHTWGEDLLRWEIRPHDEGCLLVLTHTFDDRLKAARDAAGWHLCLDALASALDHAGPAPPEDAGPIPEGWPELNAAYEQRFGIDPEEATPPPE